MSKSRSLNGKKKKGSGIVKLKIAVERLQRSLLLGKKLMSSSNEEAYDARNVPDDVKEGHVAVIAMDDYELKRFVIPLSYLTQPSFLRLLEQAAEEYGFDHEGALTLPCRPSELERILAEQREEETSPRVDGGGFGHKYWSSGNKGNMVKSF